MIYSIVRTPKRESSFHWIGPISPRKIALYKLKSRTDIVVRDWQDLKRHRIGSLFGGASTDYLKSHDLRLYEVGSPRQITGMLLEERIDLANMLNFSLAFIAQSTGRRFSDFEEVWVVDSSNAYYLAMNINSDPAIVEALQEAFSHYEREGLISRLHQKYLGVSSGANVISSTSQKPQGSVN